MSYQFKINRKTRKMRLTFIYDYSLFGGDYFQGRKRLENWVREKFNFTESFETEDSVEYQKVKNELYRKIEWKISNNNPSSNSTNTTFNNSNFKNHKGGDELDMFDIKNGLWEGLDCNGIVDDLIKELEEKEWNGEDIEPFLGGYEFLGLKDKEEQIKESKNWVKNLELTKERKRRVEELEQQINSLKNKIRDTEEV